MAGDLTKALDHWFTIQERYDTDLVSYRNPGVSDAELDAVETQLDIGLPSEVREWFKWADGFGGPNGMPNFLLGYISTYSLQGAVAEFGVFDDDALLARAIHRDQVKHSPDWVQHRRVRQTFPILSCDYQLGVECEGPAGAVCSFGVWGKAVGLLVR